MLSRASWLRVTKIDFFTRDLNDYIVIIDVSGVSTPIGTLHKLTLIVTFHGCFTWPGSIEIIPGINLPMTVTIEPCCQIREWRIWINNMGDSFLTIRKRARQKKMWRGLYIYIYMWVMGYGLWIIYRCHLAEATSLLYPKLPCSTATP